MKVLITGGTGFVGSYFLEKLIGGGHEATVVTRSAGKGESIPKGVSIVQGNPTRPGEWQSSVPGHDVVINLAGSSIFRHWTEEARESIMRSRVDTTRNLVDSLKDSGEGVLLISASGVNYYGSYANGPVFVEDSPPGNDFMASVAVRWESEAQRAEKFGVRVARCRFGVVLGRNGGALSMMLPAFRSFVGGQLGTGRQWFPWIHQEDLFNIMLFIMKREDLSGPINCCAPQVVTNSEMTAILASVLNRPLLMPSVPSFLLKTILGEFANMFVRGQKAVPKRLLESGFCFSFPDFRSALEDLTRAAP